LEKEGVLLQHTLSAVWNHGLGSIGQAGLVVRAIPWGMASAWVDHNPTRSYDRQTIKCRVWYPELQFVVRLPGRFFWGEVLLVKIELAQ